MPPVRGEIDHPLCVGSQPAGAKVAHAAVVPRGVLQHRHEEVADNVVRRRVDRAGRKGVAKAHEGERLQRGA